MTTTENTTPAGTPDAPVTAQDRINTVPSSEVDEMFEKLILELRCDSLCENNIGDWVASSEAFESALRKVYAFSTSRARQQAFSEGRKAGLKEMDEAWGNWDVSGLVEKLRQEYSAK